MEQLPVDPDAPAKVVVDEVNGVIVMGQDVRISTVAIAQGNLTISVSENPQGDPARALQPGADGRHAPDLAQVDEAKGKKFMMLTTAPRWRRWCGA